MGAKTAMTLALRTPQLIESLISVDNAPLDAALINDFAKYIQGMRKIEETEVTRQAEADEILRDYEEASHKRTIPFSHPLLILEVSYNSTISSWQPLPSRKRESTEVQSSVKNSVHRIGQPRRFPIQGSRGGAF